MNPEITKCLRCEREFTPRRAGHVFCSRECRYGSDRPGRNPADPAAVERLFDPARDSREPARDDDWHPDPSSTFHALDRVDRVATRRAWYLALLRAGRL